MADPSWSFLNITNGILSLARNSLNDIETQFIKHACELTCSFEKLSKSFQSRRGKQIQSRSSRLPMNEKVAKIELSEDNSENTESHQKSKAFRVQENQRNRAASEFANNRSEDHYSKLSSAKKPIDGNLPGGNTGSAIVSPQPSKILLTSLSQSSIDEIKPSPKSDLSGTSSDALSVKPNTTVPIRPPSLLSNENQLLFLSARSDSLHDASSSVDKAKKSTPPVSGVLQALLMEARADSVRRQGSAKPNHADPAVVSISSDSGVKPALSNLASSELPSLQQHAALSHQNAGKAEAFSAAMPFHSVNVSEVSLQSVLNTSPLIKESVTTQDKRALNDVPISSKPISLSKLDSPSGSPSTTYDVTSIQSGRPCKSIVSPKTGSEDKPNLEDFSVQLPVKDPNDSGDRESESSVAPQIVSLEQSFEPFLKDTHNAENVNVCFPLNLSTDVEDTRYEASIIKERPFDFGSEYIPEPDNLDVTLPIVISVVAEDEKSVIVTSDNACLQQPSDENQSIEASCTEPVLICVDDAEAPEVDPAPSFKEDTETEMEQSNESGENETVDDNQTDQTAKSESVWDVLSNGFSNISTNVASFVRPKALESKTKRVVEVKALKLASAKRKRDMEREEEIRLRNKRFQDAGEERKRKLLEHERRKENTVHASTDAPPCSAVAPSSTILTRSQESQKKPAERLVELSTEERRKRAEERRLALEEEERRKRQEKEEQRQLQRELLKKRRKEEEEATRKKQKFVEESSKKLGTVFPNENSAFSKDKDVHKQTSTSSLHPHKFAIPQLPAPRHLLRAKSEEEHRTSDPVIEIPTEPDPSDCESDEESDERDARKKIPKWAQNPNLLNALAMQSSIDPDAIFNPDYLKTCNLTDMFIDYSNKSRFTRRTSSGNWLQDRLGWREELEYKRRNGFLE